MTDPTVVPHNALSGRRVSLSASESDDLGRLGLSEWHCRLVIAELGRALMLAGATVMYGGRLGADTYTEILIDEAQRFGGRRRTLELAVPESEYAKLSTNELREADARLGEFGRLILIRASGEPESINAFDRRPVAPVDNAVALTAARTYVADTSDARVLVGGRLTGYAGREPGVIEEARLTAERSKPVLAAAGYGGAAAAVSNALEFGGATDWQPSSFPAHADDANVVSALSHLRAAVVDSDGLEVDRELLRILTVSHRPADIASTAVRILYATLPRA